MKTDKKLSASLLLLFVSITRINAMEENTKNAMYDEDVDGPEEAVLGFFAKKAADEGTLGSYASFLRYKMQSFSDLVKYCQSAKKPAERDLSCLISSYINDFSDAAGDQVDTNEIGVRLSDWNRALRGMQAQGLVEKVNNQPGSSGYIVEGE